MSKVLDVVPVDVPSRLTGRIFTADVVEGIIDDFNSRENTVLGELDTSPTLQVNMDRVSHSVQRLFVEDGMLKAEIKVLSTPLGNILTELDKYDVGYQACLRGRGQVNEDHIVSDFTMLTIDIIAKQGPNEQETLVDPMIVFDNVMDDMAKSGLL